jgi:hypothetical protein
MTKYSLELERLSPVDIMSFFEECVFGDQKPWADHPGLAEVGSKIVDKLKGSPLAAKTVGRLLRNKLSFNLYNLEKVQTKEEANKLKLIHKNHLRELRLCWDSSRSNKDPVKEENILESLIPHNSLQGLEISGHGGTSCPAWLCTNLSVKCLESLSLDHVSWKNLPPLGEFWMVNERGEEYQSCSISSPSFHNLKTLELNAISRLTRVRACSFLSHLDVLRIGHCHELTELTFLHPTFWERQSEEKRDWFPKLQRLDIKYCPKLESLPPIPW